MKRDEKGRFIKGESGNPETQFSGGLAVEMQARCAEKKRLKKRGRELARYMLSLPQTNEKVVADIAKGGILPEDVTNEVALHARQIEKAILKADTKAYTAVLKAAGYELETMTINLNENDEEEPPRIVIK